MSIRWQSAVVCAVCSSAVFWPRRKATRAGGGSSRRPAAAWCVRALTQQKPHKRRKKNQPPSLIKSTLKILNWEKQWLALVSLFRTFKARIVPFPYPETCWWLESTFIKSKSKKTTTLKTSHSAWAYLIYWLLCLSNHSNCSSLTTHDMGNLTKNMF